MREAVGALFIFPTHGDFSDLDLLLLDSAKFALSVQMMRSFIRFRFETRTLTELFMELVEHRWRDAGDVLQRTQRLGFDLAIPAQMIVVDLPEQRARRCARRLDLHHAVLRLAAAERGSRHVSSSVADGLVCLFLPKPGDGEERTRS